MPRDRVDAIVEAEAADPDEDTTAAEIVGRIAILSELLHRHFRELLVEHELEPGLFDVLAALRRVDPDGLTPSQLSHTTLVTSGGMTKRLDRLEAAGLVKRGGRALDRRAVPIALTAKGRRRIDRALAAHHAAKRELLAGISAAERRRIADGLRAVLLTAEERLPKKSRV